MRKFNSKGREVFNCVECGCDVTFPNWCSCGNVLCQHCKVEFCVVCRGEKKPQKCAFTGHRMQRDLERTRRA